jgi:hypothetical protein
MELKEHFVELLKTVENGEAIIWEYSVSHSRLLLRINSADSLKSIEIICLESEWICGKFRWLNCCLEISENDYMNSYGSKVQYSIKDKQNDFEIHCVDFKVFVID